MQTTADRGAALSEEATGNFRTVCYAICGGNWQRQVGMQSSLWKQLKSGGRCAQNATIARQVKVSERQGANHHVAVPYDAAVPIARSAPTLLADACATKPSNVRSTRTCTLVERVICDLQCEALRCAKDVCGIKWEL